MTRAKANAVLVGAVTVAVLLGLAGCGHAEEADEVRQLGAAERARLAVRLDALERRLVDGRARVLAWGELRERQQQVAAAASRDATWHVGEMLRAREVERVLVRSIRAPRLAVASGPGLAGDVP